MENELDALIDDCQLLSDELAHRCRVYSVYNMSTNDNVEMLEVMQGIIVEDFIEVANALNLLCLTEPECLNPLGVH